MSVAIAKPNLLLLAAVLLLLGLIGAGLLTTVFALEVPEEGFNLVDFVMVLESGINDVVLRM